MNNNPTPCGALFDVMKKHASISYKELAGLILSNRPPFGWSQSHKPRRR